MAEVFRPTYTAIDPTTGRKMKRKSPRWWIRYYSADGVRHKVKGYRDRKATEVLAGELEKKSDRLDAGMGDPFEEHAKKPLLEHLADYVRDLRAGGRVAGHVAKTEARIKAILAGCGFAFIRDLNSEKVAVFLSQLRQDRPQPELPAGQFWFTPRELVAALGGERPGQLARLLRRERLEVEGNGKGRRYPRPTVEALQDHCCRGIGISTSNGYSAAARSFSRWLVKVKRAAADPLTDLESLNADTDTRHERRALDVDELRSVLTAAADSPLVFQGLSGPARSMLYATAMVTGFRASELASLFPYSFELDSRPPVARVKAAYSKNKREAEQPLPAEMAEALAAYLDGKARDKTVWSGKWFENAAEMLRLDLEAAGITYRDEAGCVADFHALRHSYITLLERSGASPKLAQELARHSDIRLTMKVYTHARLCDKAGAVESLPSILPTEIQSNASVGVLRATGTENVTADRPANKTGPEFLGPFLGPQGEISRHFVRQGETEKAPTDPNKNPGKIAVCSAFPGDSMNLPTPDTQRKLSDSQPIIRNAGMLKIVSIWSEMNALSQPPVICSPDTSCCP